MRRNFDRWVKQYRAAEVHIKWLDEREKDASLNAVERAQEELKSTPISAWRAQEQHVAQLISWLDKHLPIECDKPTLVHGDYRCTNDIITFFSRITAALTTLSSTRTRSKRSLYSTGS